MFVIPSLIYAVEDKGEKVLISGYLLYLTLMYFNFAKSNGNAGNFTPSKISKYTLEIKFEQEKSYG